MQISDALKTRLQALGVTFTKTDRILTGNDRTTVKMTADPNPAAVASFTDGVNITINAGAIPNLGDSKTLVTLLGLNYHEVSHNLYSPRSNTHMRRTIMANGWHRAFNILEDQRIEALFSAQYGSASKFFTAPVMQLIINDEDCWPFAHIYVHGRRYLPREIREEFRKKFKGDAILSRKFERVIDEYRRMTFELDTDYQRGLRLVQTFYILMQELSPSLNQDEQNSMGQESCDCKDMSTGAVNQAQQRQSSRRLADQDEDQEAAEEQGEDGSGFWPEDDSDDESEADSDADGTEDESDGDDGDSSDAAADGDDDSDDDTENGAGDGGDSEEQPGDGQPDSVQADSDHGDESNMSGDPRGANSASSDELDADDDGDDGAVSGSASEAATGAGSKWDDNIPQLTPDQLKDLVEAIQDAIESDAEVQQEIAEIRTAMDDTSLMDVDLPVCTGRKMEAPSEIVATAKDVETQLTRLFSDLEAGWNFGTDHGRLNAMSAMLNPDDPDVWFDEWEEGHQQAAGLEVVLMMDQSGSMDGTRMKRANEALWVLVRALHEIDAKVSVIGFGQRVSRLYGREDRASASKIEYFPSGQYATIPIPGIRESRRILNESDQPNKLFVIVTDGQWDATDPDAIPGGVRAGQYVGISAELDQIDATRVYVGIGYENQPCYVEPQYAHSFHVQASITDAHGVVTVVDSIVADILRSAQSR